MAFAARSSQPKRAIEQARTPAVCRVHSCARCHASIESAEPCSFVASQVSVCRVCRSQEQVAFHLPVARSTWAADLARSRKSA